MRGRVVGLQACVTVMLHCPGQADVEIECVVDTGFEGALTLPPATVEALTLPYFTELQANLADDSDVKADVHIATIEWRGREMEIAVLAIGRRPLLGTALLEGHHFGVDFTESGLVTIEELP